MSNGSIQQQVEISVANDHRLNGGHDRNNPRVGVVRHYSAWGELAFSFLFTPLPTSIDYVCGVCGEVIGTVTDRETLQRFRYRDPRPNER
jgi:hypothetical protein